MRKTYSEIATDITNIKSLVTSDGKIDAAELQSILNSINDSYGKDVFNVKNYGAVGDGSTDDTATIDLANAAMTANGRGVLYFPYGDYKRTSTLNITVPCTIMGDGGIDSFYDYDGIPADYTPQYVSKISYYDHDTACISFPSSPSMPYTWQMYNIGLQMKHASTPISGSVGVKINAGRNFKMRDVSILDFYDNVQVNEHAAEYVIDSCTFLNPVNAQLICNNSHHTDWGDQCITNNIFRPVYRHSNYGIYMQTGGGIKICNNKFNGTGKTDASWSRVNNAIRLLLTATTSDTLICNNSMENIAEEAVYIDGGASQMYNHVFHGNQLGYSSASHHAIRFTNCWNIAISGNVLIGLPTSVECINLGNSDNATIYGNCIFQYSGANNGIYTGGTSVQVSPTVQH